jgi:vacuolar-type H+-ATPase subunit C/Vma6
MSIDTLAVARRLEAAKLPRDQAEAIASAIHESDTAALAQLATKAELGEFRAETKAELGELRAETKAEFAEIRAEIDALRKELTSELKLLEQRMTIKLGTMLVAAVAPMAALVKLL